MILTEAQKTEIRDYIITVPKYRETYNELYDHIVNSLEDSEADFSIDEVVRIVNSDFGGFSEIVYQEKIYHKEVGKKYNKHFRQEMLNTFKWPDILNNLCVLALCLMIYYSNEGAPFNMKPMLIAIIVCVVAIAVFAYSKIFINRYKYSKYSIFDNYFGYSCSFGITILNLFIHFLNKNNSFGISEDARLILLLCMFFFCSVYVRAFIKFYNKKFKILTT